MFTLFHWLTQLFGRLMIFLEQAFLHLTQPSRHSIMLSTVADLTRTKSDLIAENALLQQQLIVLHRQVKKPAFSQSERLWLVLLASHVKNWKESMLIFKPDTLLGWHRLGFRLFWKFKSRNHGGRPKLAAETIALIQQMAQENRLWGAERIRGELYPDHNDEAVRLILLELKAKGIRPRVVVSDLDPAYGRMLPLVFPNAIHHECIFHALQFWSSQMTKMYGRYYLEKVPEVVPLHDAFTNLFNAQTQKTVRKRYAALMALRETYVTKTPAIATVFDSVERHFPKLVNAIESTDIPRTNNATELVIRRLDQHYQAMCGLDTLESAKIYLRMFELVYRLTPFADDGRRAIRGKSPLELAGYDVKALPIADFFMNLKLPPLSTEAHIMYK